MQVVLEGKFVTPVVYKYSSFYLHGCKAKIKKGTIRRQHYSKIDASIPMYPYSLICYEGIVQVIFECHSKQQAEKKLDKLMAISQIGKLQSEGLGKIQWLSGRIHRSKKEYGQDQKRKRPQKLKMRKGLPHDLPSGIQELVRYGLLHDFFHNSLHHSKIYVEPPLEDAQFIELLKDHHENKLNSPLVQRFQKYDRIASSITRKNRSPRPNRYNWKAKATQKIDFQLLAQNIAEVSNNLWKLYEYIYKNKKLEVLNESFEFGHTSLRRHLLIIANLIVSNYLRDSSQG